MSELLKISDLIRNKRSFTFSFEVTPDVGEAELDKITLQPEFYSITWHALSHQYSFNANRSDFKTSSEMISYIRAKTSDYFCIGVAGFPYDDCKITALKEKIDLGADFVISQAFFESNVYKNYLEKCKDAKIDVPIIPGIFPFQSQKELDMFLKLCKVKVTEEFRMKLEEKSENVMDIIENLVLDLRNNLNVKHFHFFTINKLGITCELVKNIQLSL
ncbi:Methylenetetrahydrofolate reductase [Papilio xuthus]|uniref:Methylenetetrahydrofolate reductase n=1 Tax=Papilio xuthus TaxID=66420 RepID=A0A194PN72_PAPXU|nr:Methylenetetrahydrofolate reductase [Papilio xuthus]